MRIEFVAGILIFAIILIFIVNQTNITFRNLLSDSRSDILKSKALNVITILTEDPGSPSNWNVNIWSTRRVGLATGTLELSRIKIDALYDNCNLLDDFDLGSYRLRIYDSSDLILFCGYDMLDSPSTIETRHVDIDGDYGNVTLEFW